MHYELFRIETSEQCSLRCKGGRVVPALIKVFSRLFSGGSEGSQAVSVQAVSLVSGARDRSAPSRQGGYGGVRSARRAVGSTCARNAQIGAWACKRSSPVPETGGAVAYGLVRDRPCSFTQRRDDLSRGDPQG